MEPFANTFQSHSAISSARVIVGRDLYFPSIWLSGSSGAGVHSYSDTATAGEREERTYQPYLFDLGSSMPTTLFLVAALANPRVKPHHVHVRHSASYHNDHTAQ